MDIRKLKPGDKLRCHKGFLWWHEALYAGQNTHGRHLVYERKLFGVRRVTLDSLRWRSLFWPIQHVTYRGPTPRSVILRRAESRLGERGYHPFKKNCEQFVSWCQDGVPRSEQVEKLRKLTVYARVLVVSGIDSFVNV